MNIFYLDKEPLKAAQCLVDRHVVKMCLEYAQLLSTAHHLQGEPTGSIYKPTHRNHPSAVWTRESKDNYLWLYDLYVYTGEEYTYRFGRIHGAMSLKDSLKEVPSGSPINKGSTRMPLAMPVEYWTSDDPIECYRQYYRIGKSRLHKWTKRNRPDWI